MNQHPDNHADGHDEESRSGSLSAMPDCLGGVTLERLIGQGGMGRVYLGHHPILDVEVAIKVMRAGSGSRNRFLTEARLAARVQHEHIVRILHAGDEGGFCYLILEYVPGRNLKQLVHDRGPLPWREAADITLQAARGLAAAHRQGIVHRDVKPSNLLQGADGRIKVADLGLARALIGDSTGGEESSFGDIVGTPAYMAPEQAKDAHLVTPAADVYGLGASLYYLLTGEAPFPGRSFRELLAIHRQGTIPDPSTRSPDMPAALGLLTQRMLAKSLAQRPADGAAVVVELERLLGLATSSTTAVRPLPMPSRHQRLWWAAAGLAGIGTVLVGWGHAGSQATEPPPAVAAAPPAAAAAPAVTPTRAVFVLAGPLPAAAQAGLAEACRASGLPVVERSRIDALVAEQRLVGEGRIEAQAAVRLGRLVGGHIAIFAEPVEALVEVRCVLVETGELVACRLVPPGEVATAVTAGLAAAIDQLPLQATIERRPDAIIVLAGRRHGLRVGDQLVVRRDPAGPATATATVIATEAAQATVALDPAGADLAGTSASRVAR